MAEPSNKISLPVALKKHCSIEGETTSEFMAEYKKLDITDKQWFAKQFEKEFGYNVLLN